MKTRKIIAICMIISSMFLQISYAVANSEQTLADTQRLGIHFSDLEYRISDDCGFAEILIHNENSANISIAVNNIYPGLIYSIDAVLQNSGTQNAKITGIDMITDENSEEGSKRLYDMIVGIKADDTKLKLEEYIKHLSSEYSGKTIDSGKSLPLYISMGMDENITDLENTKFKYQIIVNFEQAVNDDEDDDNNGGGGDENGEDDSKDPAKEKETDKVPETENKPQIEDDDITEVDINYPLAEEKVVFSEEVSEDMLPNTGEKSPITVYISGLALMLGGILLLKKENAKI